LALAIEEKYDQVRQLIAMGKERGYLLYDEVNDILPAEVHSSEEIDDLLSTFERYGIDIYEDAAAAKAARATADPTVADAPEIESKDDLPVAEDAGELDLTPGMLEKTNDPVRMYLREMGTVPLLTREGEVAIAKRIERGQLLVLKTITRSPIIVKELVNIGEDLRKGTRSIKEIVQFDDEELTEEKIENKTKKIQGSRPDRQALQRMPARGGEARADAQVEEAALHPLEVSRFAAARRDVATGALDRISSV